MRTHEQACNVRSLVVQRVMHAFRTAAVLNQVQLIEDQNLLDVVGADVAQYAANLFDLFKTSRVCSVYHM